MPILIERPTRIEAAGTPPKRIDEFVGRVNTRDEQLSIAHMRSPPGWSEPGQTPKFDEYTLVLTGLMKVEHHGGEIEVSPGQALLARAGEWVRYSTPNGADYISVCLPAFSPLTVNRDPSP
jgi:quercetin dioxygenase-like cupin family protein